MNVEGIVYGLMIAIVAFFIFMAGTLIEERSFINDCNSLGSFRAGAHVYECKKITEE